MAPKIGEALGEVVVGQPNAARTTDDIWMRSPQPCPGGDREARGRHAAQTLRPCPGPAEGLDQPIRIGRRACVVPQHRRMQGLCVAVEHDEPVLLGRHRDRGDPIAVPGGRKGVA